ncbi:MAG TPA: chloramphenicol acetyltransferase [Flavobacterium sp.]|nr:chloramphenicol acetyltransferase [Flavobacterium sp.]
MKTKLDLSIWPRKEHFEFFSKFEEPFFGIAARIDCTKAYETSKENGVSFFLYYLHKTLCAANAVENFKYRIDGGAVFVYDQIDASATLTRDDNTFGFSLIPFFSDFGLFQEKALAEIERVRNTPGLFTRSFETDNLIHFSALPWVDFTSLSHARGFAFPDSCPKISIGKMTIGETGKRTMAVSVHAHHGLMDGYHIGQFFTKFQEFLDS